MQQAYFDFSNIFYDEDIRYISPAKVIGKHEWRIVIYQCREFRNSGDKTKGTRFTYQWRRTGFKYAAWEAWEKWSSFNHNDGQHYGCPKSLSNLDKEYEDQTARALGEEITPPASPKVKDLPLFTL